MFVGWRNSREDNEPKSGKSTEMRVLYGAEIEVCDCYAADDTSKMYAV